MTQTRSAGEAADGLGFEAELLRNVRRPRYPEWLPGAMRLRYYLPALAAWLFIGAAFGAGPLWWAGLAALFAFHWAAHRARWWGDYLRERELLRGICGGGAPITSYYRRGRPEAIDANPPADPALSFGEHLASASVPSHHMRKMHARRIFGKFSRPGLLAGDVGCLAGDVSAEHVRAGHTAFLFDLDLAALRLAREKTGRPVAQADAGRLPLRPGALEFITLFEVIEHLADPAAAMRELAAGLQRIPILSRLGTYWVLALKKPEEPGGEG